MHGSHWSLRPHAARPPPTADRTEPDQRERVCETLLFVRRAFQILPFARKDGRRHCFEKRRVILSHLKYEIERIRHDPQDELLKSSPFCSKPAAPVSITVPSPVRKHKIALLRPLMKLPPARMRYLADSKLSEPLLSIPYNSRCSCSVLCSSEQTLFGATELVRYLWVHRPVFSNVCCRFEFACPRSARQTEQSLVRESNISTVRESKIRSFSTGLDGTQSKP